MGESKRVGDMKKLQRVITTAEQLENTFTYIRRMGLPKNGVEITVMDYEEVRTINQNKFLWSQLYQPCAEQISEATGAMLTKDDMHEFFTDKFGARVIRTLPNEFHDETGLITLTKSVPKSTTKYTKQEMSDYLEACFAWGAQHQVWFS
jgi:hypothetical protein